MHINCWNCGSENYFPQLKHEGARKYTLCFECQAPIPCPTECGHKECRVAKRGPQTADPDAPPAHNAADYTKDQLVMLLAQARRRLLMAQSILESEGCLEEEDGEDNVEFCEMINIGLEVPDLIGAHRG